MAKQKVEPRKRGTTVKRGTKAKKPEHRVDETLMEPGEYEVTSDTVFSITVCLKRTENRWSVVTGTGKDVHEESVTMRMWTYDEMVTLRKKATGYDANKRMHIVDHDALNRLKAQKLFVDWTFQDRNKRIVLHRVNGVMTDESWKKFTRLQPNIIKYIFDKMNEIYEYNG
jgi:hypothetical protein